MKAAPSGEFVCPLEGHFGVIDAEGGVGTYQG